MLDFEKNNIDLIECTKKFNELEFYAILKQLKNWEEVSHSTNEQNFKKDYKIVLNNDDLSQMIKTLTILI